jgi:hypothetical protein
LRKGKSYLNEAKLRNLIRQVVKEELKKANANQSPFGYPSELEQEYQAYQEFLRKQQEEINKNPWNDMFEPAPSHPQAPKSSTPSQWPKGFDPDFEF